MRHAEYPAPPELAHLVRCVWVFEGHFDAAHDERIVPDGCPELILHFGTPYREPHGVGTSTRWQLQSALLLAGNLTRALRLRAEGTVGVLGIRLWPQAVAHFTNAPVASTLDMRLPLRHALLARWREELARGGDEARLALVPHLMAALARHTPRHDAAVNLAVASIFTSRGQVAPETLARDSGLSLRQLERRLLAATGLGPKPLASLVRFRAVFDELEAQAPSPWLSAALAAGYFDQPHMIREFRRYAGLSPKAYLANAGRLATALVSTRAA